MKTIYKRIIMAALPIALIPAAAWLSGYNFDHRGPDIAVGFVVTLFLAAWMAAFPFEDS